MTRFLAGCEILLVAMWGQFLASMIWISLISSESPLSSSGSFFAFQMIDFIFTLAVVGGLLHLNGQSWRTIGWRGKGTVQGVLAGVAALPLLFAATWLSISTVSRLFPSLASGPNPLLELIQTPQDVALFSASSLLTGGFKEEIQRAFILERFKNGLGGVWAGLAVWSVVFGLLHVSQGYDRAIGAGFLGLIFGLLYLWRRHLAAPVCAHGLFDLTVVFLTWWQR